ncbi:MAG: hypothetical protein JXB39_15165 [Deltaproteobacteria bacterium]|nr:hypothetical protein [Deltaproteobacteria bacterium]
MWTWALLVVLTGQVAADDLDEGWYYADSRRLEEATHIAVAALGARPDDLEAHRLYIRAMTSGLQEDDALHRQYRLWMEREPDHPVPRVALASLLLSRERAPGPWCAEVEDLLAAEPTDPGLRFEAIRIRYQERIACGRDAASDRRALVDLASTVPDALATSVRVRLEAGRTVDEALARDLRAWYAHEPCELTAPGNLWDERLRGPALKQARADALAAARQALGTPSAACAHSALRLFRRAGNDPGMVEAAKRRAELDPGWRVWEKVEHDGSVSQEAGRSRLEHDLEGARFAASLEVARRRLAVLERRIPPSGPLRAMWLKETAFVLLREGRAEEAFATFKAAWQQDPANRSVANAFAYTAALQGRELELALVVVESVLTNLPPYDPWIDGRHAGYDAWATRTSDQIAARMDTRGWILHQLGRSEEAAAVLQQALLLRRTPDPILHHHLGLVLQALGKEEAALQQLGRGLALGPSEEPELDTRAQAAGRQLFQTRRWASAGFDAWLATRLPAASQVADDAGSRLADLVYQVDGRPHRLSDAGGIRVVVLWSARSQPFLDSLPRWAEIDRRYRKAGVRFIALSTDDRPEIGSAFWEGVSTPPFELGWLGPQAAAGIAEGDRPVAFVLDAKGTVRGRVPGRLLEEDHRVDHCLDALIGPPPP